MLAKPNAAENRCGVHANVRWGMGIDTPWVFALMEFVEFREEILKTEAVSLWRKRKKK